MYSIRRTAMTLSLLQQSKFQNTAQFAMILFSFDKNLRVVKWSNSLSNWLSLAIGNIDLTLSLTVRNLFVIVLCSEQIFCIDNGFIERKFIERNDFIGGRERRKKFNNMQSKKTKNRSEIWFVIFHFVIFIN